jgi:hypothetical protein
MNRLLRQYFPKGTDLVASSQAELNRTALQLNHRIDDYRAALRGPELLGVQEIDLGEPLDATLDRAGAANIHCVASHDPPRHRAAGREALGDVQDDGARREPDEVHVLDRRDLAEGPNLAIGGPRHRTVARQVVEPTPPDRRQVSGASGPVGYSDAGDPVRTVT